jgi:lipid-A-disaccharide synthase-like uncharacterized protein
MIKGAVAAWVAFWVLGVAGGLIALVAVGWKAGVVVFAIGLVTTVTLLVVTGRKGYKMVMSDDAGFPRPRL